MKFSRAGLRSKFWKALSALRAGSVAWTPRECGEWLRRLGADGPVREAFQVAAVNGKKLHALSSQQDSVELVGTVMRNRMGAAPSRDQHSYFTAIGESLFTCVEALRGKGLMADPAATIDLVGPLSSQHLIVIKGKEREAEAEEEAEEADEYDDDGFEGEMTNNSRRASDRAASSSSPDEDDYAEDVYEDEENSPKSQEDGAYDEAFEDDDAVEENDDDDDYADEDFD